MKKPYIICHMMTSVDGRIDCDMTAQLQGQNEYYDTLKATKALTTISGRVTAELELAQAGKFEPTDNETLGKEAFSKKVAADNYNIIMDTKGTLLWEDDSQYSRPHLIITSEEVTNDYLEYLDSKNISWIATGEEHIDLARAVEILATEFKIERLAIVGGGKIDGGFLDAGLIDEISILMGPGVDGRTNAPSVFDGRANDSHPLALKLQSVQSYDDGAIWIRYQVQK
ncbi:dihydrofolate reductase family protein [Companilactobacillus farciminis]|uniref:dihydrofolate reductase family protein n=1 Tax=Companilactobacillus farciminis TaxID=1612 RepID=UPI0034D67F53